MSERNWHEEGISLAEYEKLKRAQDPRGRTIPRDPGLGPLHRDDVEDPAVWSVGLTIVWALICVGIGGPEGFLLFFAPYLIWFVYAILRAFIKGSLGMD